MREALTQSELKRQLDYDPETGVFVWRDREPCPPSFRCFVGKEAGNMWKGGRRVTYRILNINGRPEYAHRMAFLWMTGRHPDGVVDHIDRNSLNNAWSNLRIVDRSINALNSDAFINNTTGHRGVYLDKRRGVFCARLKVAGECRWLGSFPTAEEAGSAYESALSKHLSHVGAS